MILGEYASDDPEPPGTPESFADNDADDEAMPTFTVTNPPGTVTVTTYMDGRVHQVELSPKAATLTETVLAEEIVVIAGLATQDARSAQYTFMLEGHARARPRQRRHPRLLEPRSGSAHPRTG